MKRPPAASTVKRHLVELRKDCIEGSLDPVEKRIAYAMEQAVRWATEATTGWPKLAVQAEEEAALLRKELGLPVSFTSAGQSDDER